MLARMFAVQVVVQILSLMHPQRALVFQNGHQTEAKAGQTYEGPFAIEVPGLPKRNYRGRLKVEAGPHELILWNEVELEDYVASVVGSELDAAPKAAQQALAIAARTYALKLKALNENLCDTTHCQFYKGRGAEIRTGTDGEVLYDGEHLALPHYEARCERKGCLSQEGAARLASHGADAHQILARYYPAFRLVRLLSAGDSR
jgi:peptidoglycan hydrolase-like amidase